MEENNTIIEQLKVRSAKLYWTYVIQYSQAEKYHKTQKRLTLLSLILSALVASTAFLNVIEVWGIPPKWSSLIIFFLGISSTIILSFCGKFNYEKRIAAHTESATAIRRLWMKYQSLITDIKAGRYLQYEDICIIRDNIRDEEYEVLKCAPITLQQAYKKAEEKIHKKKHGEITPEEIIQGNENQNI